MKAFLFSIESVVIEINSFIIEYFPQEISCPVKRIVNDIYSLIHWIFRLFI